MMPPLYFRLFYTFITVFILAKPSALYSQGCEKVKLTDFPKNDLPATIDTSLAKRAELIDGSIVMVLP